ncbi:MAG: carbohydrate kinase family protein, partial [Advenella sp.]
GAFGQVGDQSFRVPGYPVEKVVDTVGAGDGFAAGLISGRLEGLDWQASVRRATIIGACAVQVAGDTEGYPDRARLAELDRG